MNKKRFLLAFFFPALLVGIYALAEDAKKEEKSEADKPKQVEGKEPEKAKVGTPIALTMEAIQEMEERKKSLDARERILNEKAKAMEIQEKVLKEKLSRMEELNKKMTERLDKFKASHEEKIGKLVSVVETMKPQAAAEYVENLDPDLAVEILTRIQVAKAAKIMNLVDRKKSARLTELYTGYRDKIEEPTAAPIAPAPGAENKEAPNTTGKM